MFASGCCNCLLACEFCLAINAERICLPILTARHVAVALKYIVGAHVYQRTVYFLHSSGKIACSRIVKQIGKVVVAFGFVYVGIGCTVDNNAYAAFLYHRADGVKIGDVELLVAICYICEDIMMIATKCHTLHFVSELTVGTSY